MSQTIHRRKPVRQENVQEGDISEESKENSEGTPQPAVTPSWKLYGTPCVGTPHKFVTPVGAGGTCTHTPQKPQSLRNTPTSRLAGRNDSFGRRSPLSPLQNLMGQLRSKVDRQLCDSKPSTPTSTSTTTTTTSASSQNVSHTNLNTTTTNTAATTTDDNISPGLARLRNTPVGVFKARQELLMRKHESARSRTDSLCVGGGVSLWPCMDRMRLTREEGAALVVISVGLVVLSVCVFHAIHGSLHENLVLYYHRASGFSQKYPIHIHSGGSVFNTSLLEWHTAYTALLDDVRLTFDVTLSNTTLFYKSLVILYVTGLGVLVYYLVDNIWAKSKLTPKRIRVWVCILAVIGTWTLLGLQLLVLAQALETTLEQNVHGLSGMLSDLVYVDLDLTTYHNVLLYWRTRLLPPTTRGSLCIMGVVAVRDVAYYLQYYSLPVITALLTPVIQLVLALRDIYWIKTHH